MRLKLILSILILGGLLATKAQVTPAEKQALQGLYNATNGPNWATETDGLLGDEWDFDGVVTSDWYGVTVQNGHVVELDLEFNELAGSIPPSIGDLVHLTLLNLSTNELTGSIPNEIGNLTELQTLDLFNNNLSGNLPPSLGNLTNLEALYLYRNNLDGAIPVELGNMVSLAVLYLDDNELTGSIPPELGNLTNLTRLWLYSNNLSGAIPPELGNLTNLVYLSLHTNNLSGPIPPELGNLSNLTYLNLSNNVLSGTIPPELGNLTNLVYLALHNNNLDGSIPLELGNLTNLTHLWLYSNNLSGAIPPELGNLTNLVYLALHNNNLDGSIPLELGNLVNLSNLFLASNELDGTIPLELVNLVDLRILDVKSNNLDGTIPPELGNLTSLERLYLSNNLFTGTIPLELENLVNLTHLNLNINDLTGNIPPELGNLTNLEWLYLGSNNLSGGIPTELANLTNLTHLGLYSNNLSGAIPPELGNLTNLVYLGLHNNNLNGSIPLELGNLVNLTTLSLHTNNLSGPIPPELGNLSNLTYLNLSNNVLSGTIPPELGNLSNLIHLTLDRNNLYGSIPPELGNLTNLTYLNLYNNGFNGNIPPEIIDQTPISSFYVDNNLFDFGHLEYAYLNFNGNTFDYIPQQKTDQPEVLQVQEGGDIILTTAVSGSQNHYQWYKDGQPINGAPDSPDYDITNATLLDAGTYHCVMTSDVVLGLPLTRHYIELSVVNNPAQQEEENWNIITVWDYDMDTNLKANTRRYYNELGKHVQTQSWDAVTHAIWGQVTLYDYQGRPGLSSLSAPIPGQTEFQYHASFITDEEGAAYTTEDFDMAPFNPDSVHDDGPLGAYYTGVTSDQYQDITTFPFSRTVFSSLNPGTALAVVGGNKADTNGDNNLTAEDEWPQAYTFTMPATDELSLDVAFDDLDYKSIKTLKTVNRDVHGNETVVFTDTDGKLLATARSGENGVLSPPMKLYIGAQGYVDVYIPKGVTGISVSNENAVTLYNLITDALEPTPAKNLPPGLYRVAVNDMENYVPNKILVSYRVNYYDYSLNKYDEAGRLVSSYQPITDGNGKKLVTTYEYNTLGQLIGTTSPDEGTAEFKYRKDGQIRYSQNSEQAMVGEVSYTDYDTFARPVESGVLMNVDFSNLDPDDPLPQANKKETMGTIYDFLENEDYNFLGTLDPDYQHPSFLAGNVAKTFNNNATTYYSYDGYGRVKWLVQDIDGLGTKTIDYGYEPLTGLVQKVIYQKGREDQFVHRYTYNERDQLVQVETSVDDSSFELQAEYIYSDAGTLVRTEIADGAQGLDYVYNLAGQLKSINHPSLNPAKDPGGDINDLFGMQLDYHLGDYQRTENSNITTAPQGNDQFNGNIKGIRWQTSVNGSQESQYVYSYDRNNWLTGADFAPDDNNNKAYDVGKITYDANGNIQSLARNKDPDDQDDTSMDHLTYNYDPKKPNRLLWVDDAAGNAPNADDLDDQAEGNYQYNTLGQLTYDHSGKITYIYNASGLVTEVQRNGEPLVKFFYNDRNHRVKKETYENGGLASISYYVRDVAGSVMAVYSDAGGEMALAEQPVYGAGRIGIAYNGMNNDKTYVYELTDHLGNVRAVFTKSNNDATLEGYTDYYPGGMAMPNRNLEDANNYRYGYQGEFAEEDDETGLNAFELRMYDSRIGRWLSPDPYRQFASPYLAMGNNHINFIDTDGGMCTDADGNVIPCPDGYSAYSGPTEDNAVFWENNLGQYEFAGIGLQEVSVSPRYTMTITRDVQTENSTTSSFDLNGGSILSSLNVSGYFLEPAGPDTTVPNQDMRIPEGTYNLSSHNGTRFQNVYKLYNDDVPQSRAILIHTGNFPRNTEGCLLPGLTRGTDRVGRSRPKLNQLRIAIDEMGVENVLIKIHNKFHNPIFPSQNPSDYN